MRAIVDINVLASNTSIFYCILSHTFDENLSTKRKRATCNCSALYGNGSRSCFTICPFTTALTAVTIASSLKLTKRYPMALWCFSIRKILCLDKSETIICYNLTPVITLTAVYNLKGSIQQSSIKNFSIICRGRIDICSFLISIFCDSSNIINLPISINVETKQHGKHGD